MILDEFYLEILNRLNSVEIGIQYIDLWNDQIEKNQDKEDNLFFNYPAVFLDIHPIEWITLGRKKQAAIVEFDIIVASESLHETSSIETPEERILALKHLKLLEDVFINLHGYFKAFDSGNSFGSISRNGMNFEFEGSDQINSNVIPFKCRMVDVSAMKKTVKKGSNVVLNNAVKLP
ncbi:hypothetical protein PL373_06010 [Tenacibaculum maritimum]|nr:hypothetical protein [Tenacibaculum maritimum]MDB0600705.1 hypothetical protein [Tenacibaculum maritimum]MDB0612688.1 hypothetical protein [Tenacibaculum maritimum]